jgi:transcription antitermination factor NusG
MFPSYLFVHDVLDKQRLIACLRVEGVVAVLGASWKQPAVVDDSEIEAVQRIVDNDLAVRPHPYLRAGMHVRVVRGPLTGLGGILVRDAEGDRLVVSVEIFQRSVAVEIDAHSVVSR